MRILAPFWFIGIIAFCLLLTPFSAAQHTPVSTPIVITHATVINPGTSSVRADQTVVITGDHITSVSETAGFQLPKNARVIDATGHYLIPGLWDMHVHSAFGDWFPGGRDIILPLFIANGVTGVRDMGGDIPVLLKWRKEIADGQIVGPRMVISGPMLDGYLPNGKLRFPSSIAVTSPASAVAAVDSLKKQGVDFIKVQSVISHDDYLAAAAEAHKQGLPIVGHVPDKVRIAEVAAAGQKSIEHLMGIFEGCSTEEDKFITGEGNLKLLLTTQDQQRCDSLTQLLAQNQTWQVPTLAWQRGGTFLDQRDLKHQPLDKYVPAYWRDVTWRRFTDEMMPDLLHDPLALRQEYFARNLQMVGALHHAGVPFMAGTDAAPGVYIMPGFSLHDELANFVEAGFTPMESLQTATSNPAKFLGMEDSLGSIDPGKIADLVLLSANPLQDIRNTEKITIVIAHGRLFDRAALDQILMKVEAAAKRQSPAADLVLLHGHILTVDAKDSVVQAVAIRHGVIVKTGSDAEVMEFAGKAPGLRIVDLHGHTATPGLIDTHAHIADGGVQELYGVKLSDTTSIAEIVSRVKAKIALVKPGEWVTGSGWDEGKLGEHRYVTSADLDAVSPSNPVWLGQITGHYGVANSVALKLAHLTPATVDPPAGTIDRDVHGAPTGVLKEDSAMNLVAGLIPAVTPEQMRQGILYIQQVLHSEGMTAVKDPDIFQIHWDAYKSLLDQGQLKERICVLWHAGSTLESARKALAEINSVPRLPTTLGDDRLLSCGAKIYMDGSGGARTGWVYDDRMRNATTPDITSSGTGNRGYPQIDPVVYQQMVRLFHQNGVPVGTHAVGDRAMDWVVDTYALVEQEHPQPGLRHSIIHANLPTPHALDVMVNLQKKYDSGYPEMQAEFLWWIGDIYAGNYGPKRGQSLEPFKTLHSRGILWSGGSDYPVTPVAARYGLWASAARQTAKGTYGANPFGTAEALDIHTALRSYTAWGARQLFLENKIGSLEVGKQADIAVWDRDVYAVPADQIKDMKCLMTLFDGEVVYTSPQSPITTAVR